MTRISVCIPTFNGEKYLKQQLESILHQLSANDEVIISDDSSTDGTVNLIKQFKDDRIILLENGKFRNPVYNMERSLAKAKGEFIFLADQDDVWMGNKVEIMLKNMEKHDLVMSDCILVNENLDVLKNSLFAINRSKTGLFYNLIKNTYTGCCMAFRRKLLDKALPFPRNIPMHDIWLGFVGEVSYSPIFISDKLILHRRHEANASATSNKSPYGFLTKLNFRWQIAKHFFRIRFKSTAQKPNN